MLIKEGLIYRIISTDMQYQPRDLWEWLLKLAITLFPLDVGVRRIQIDRAEWLRATQTLRRWLFFWRGPQRPPEADELALRTFGLDPRERGIVWHLGSQQQSDRPHERQSHSHRTPAR